MYFEFLFFEIDFSNWKLENTIYPNKNISILEKPSKNTDKDDKAKQNDINNYLKTKLKINWNYI